MPGKGVYTHRGIVIAPLAALPWRATLVRMEERHALLGATQNLTGLALRLGGAVTRRATDVAGRTALAGLDAVLGSPYTDEALARVLDRLLAEDIAERVAGQITEGPELERIVERLLQTEGLWLLVDEIAGSPAVTEAISQQGFGLADQVAGEVRQRSERADARLERVARRLLRRRLASPAGAAESHLP